MKTVQSAKGEKSAVCFLRCYQKLGLFSLSGNRLSKQPRAYQQGSLDRLELSHCLARPFILVRSGDGPRAKLMNRPGRMLTVWDAPGGGQRPAHQTAGAASCTAATPNH